MELSKSDQKKLRGFKGGVALHLKHPEHAVKAGKKGGDAVVRNNPHLKTSEHGRRLVAAREAKRHTYNGRVDFANKIANICPPVGKSLIGLKSDCDTCVTAFSSECKLLLMIKLQEDRVNWYKDAKQSLKLLQEVLSNPQALQLAKEEFIQQKISPS